MRETLLPVRTTFPLVSIDTYMKRKSLVINCFELFNIV